MPRVNKPISKIRLAEHQGTGNTVRNIDKPAERTCEANSVKAVTLLVTPEQAEKLALAASEGKLQLVMRNSIDQGDEQTKGIDKRGPLEWRARHASAGTRPRQRANKLSNPRPVRQFRTEPKTGSGE